MKMLFSQAAHTAVAVVFVALFSTQAYSQAPAKSGCSLPDPPFRTNHPNIFGDRQEQWLGEAQAGQIEPYYDLLPEKDSSELERIGQKLLSQLPPTPIHYHFRVYESAEANGFSLAGGFVYISRKLITDARSEDELAGVLAHEIGHIYTHQIAVDFTRELKAMLNVSSVGGPDDVADKAQMLLNAPWKDRADQSEDEEDKDELLADRVGMYALIKAGYAPRAFSENLDRIAANNGKTGNLLTDFLGATDPISRRVRVARKIAASLPEGCGQVQASSSPEFKAFQESVRSVPIHPLIDATVGLTAIKLDPPMRQSLRQVRFSPDGKYILAQNQSAIHVLSRSPLKRLFSIDARDAELAHFTPDSSHVVFHYSTMRVEKWSIAEAKLESLHELVDYEGCLQTSLSPDGRTFVCLSRTDAGVWLKMTDVESGKRFFDNKTVFGPPWAGADIIVRTGGGTRVGTVAYSQDGRTMMVLAGAKSLAFDLDERKPISLGKDLSRIIDGRVSFVDSDKLVYQCDWGEDHGSSKDTFKICESSFPDGLALNSFRVGYQWIESLTKGNQILIGPFKDNAAMLVDPSTGKASAGFKLDALDIYGEVFASENENGGVTVGAIGSSQIEQLDLPISPITNIEAAEFSPDGRFLAYSTKFRSSIWDLSTQKRVSLMRPFREVRFDQQNVMFAQFPQAGQKPGANYQIDLKTGKSAETSKYAIDQFQRGDVLVTFQPLEKTGGISTNVNMEVADGVTGAALWSRHFAHETPIVRPAEDGSLLFIVDLYDESASPEANHAGAKLVKSSDSKTEWLKQGLLVEIVDCRSGDLKRALQVPQRAGEVLRTAALFGEFLVVRGVYNNSTIYRITDGQRLGAFSGRVIAGDGKLGLIAATNRDQDVIVYDATNGKELKRVTVDQLPRAARFIPAKNELLVMTANQRVYTIDVPPIDRAEPSKGQ